VRRVNRGETRSTEGGGWCGHVPVATYFTTPKLHYYFTVLGEGMPAPGFMGWHSCVPVPSYCSGWRLVVAASLLAALLDGLKTETRRVVKEGTAKIIFNLVKSQKWFRFMRDRANDTMCGWGTIRRAYYQRMEHMDEGVPLREGFPGHSLLEFQGLGFFKGLVGGSYLLVLEFDFHALGPPTAPYPPFRVMTGEPCIACRGARGNNSGMSSCGICEGSVHEDATGCSRSVMKVRVDNFKKWSTDGEGDESDGSDNEDSVNAEVLVCPTCACEMGLIKPPERDADLLAARAPLSEHSDKMPRPKLASALSSEEEEEDGVASPEEGEESEESEDDDEHLRKIID
jgi:hypothetical protein